MVKQVPSSDMTARDVMLIGGPDDGLKYTVTNSSCYLAVPDPTSDSLMGTFIYQLQKIRDGRWFGVPTGWDVREYKSVGTVAPTFLEDVDRMSRRVKEHLMGTVTSDDAQIIDGRTEGIHVETDTFPATRSAQITATCFAAEPRLGVTSRALPIIKTTS